ncbi:MAG: DUF3168 domain-containing protein [Actinomycetota bacterium]|nr:DUF3168 domain-containing protein [Actinomycetota bacterium]
MTLESDIVDQLSTDLGHSRIFPAPLPQGTQLPAVVYQRITTARLRAHEGTVLVGPLIQFTCWSNTARDAFDLGRAVVSSWENRLGEALVEDTRDGYEPGAKLYRRDVDVRLWASLDDELADLSS